PRAEPHGDRRARGLRASAGRARGSVQRGGGCGGASLPPLRGGILRLGLHLRWGRGGGGDARRGRVRGAAPGGGAGRALRYARGGGASIGGCARPDVRPRAVMTPRILVIDDEADIRLVARSSLELIQAWEVLEADSGQGRAR